MNLSGSAESRASLPGGPHAEPLRALLISSCFPHPANMRLGVWALSQAEALARHGVDLRVISPTSLVPRLIGKFGLARWAAECPQEAQIGSLRVGFPRWVYYYAGVMRPVIRRFPGPVFSAGWPLLRRALLNEITIHRPHVIFANHTLDGGEAARRIRSETGINFVVAEHDYGEINDCRRFPARRTHYRRVMIAAACVLAVSERMRSDILSLFPAARVQVARYGREPLPPELFSRPRPAGVEGKTIVLSVSGFFERKAIPLLIEAFGRVANRHPDAELRIVGDGPERDKVAAAAALHDKTGQVRLLGALAHERVLQEMIWADAFALTGWDEPFATVYVEALAAGKPIVCCNDGGICDVLQDGVQALLVPPHDVGSTALALERLIGDKALRSRMAAAARQLFSDKLTTEAYAGTMAHELSRAAGWPEPVNSKV